LPHGGEEEETRALKPVVTIEAQVLQTRMVPAGATVGYGGLFTAPEAMQVATLNIGYADGYLRAFGQERGWAWAGDTRCPVLGRISMDLIAVATGAAPVAEGDWLRMDYDLPAQARATGLSQYELLTLLGRRYQRRWL
jgi:alanine racemase